MFVILGLGANTGDRRMQLKRAVLALKPHIHSIRCSPVYASPALLPDHAPGHWDKPFLNMALCGQTHLPPHALLAAVKQIEQDVGRVRRGHWGPREIDIDILAYGQQVINVNDLIVPHPGLTERDFALVPLADIAPDWIYPHGEHKGLAASALVTKLRPSLHKTDITFCSTELMGIVNLTPDSFSGDGLLGSPVEALMQIDAIRDAGASLIDIGAESTRPGAAALTAEEEWERLAPLLKALGDRPAQAAFSIDTRHPATMQKALDAGMRWINDVSGSHDPQVAALLRGHDATLVLTHSLSVPADPLQTLPNDIDPVEEVLAWARRRIAELEALGVARTQLVFDPGIGFGKTAAQSFALLQGISRFKTLGVPLLVGHSRKSFLSLAGDALSASRDLETLAVSSFLAQQGVDYLRIHDVASHRTMLQVIDALL